MSFIYKYKTSTLTPFVKPRNVFKLAVQNDFYIQSYVESALTYNLRQPVSSLLGSNQKWVALIELPLNYVLDHLNIFLKK